MLYKVFQAQWKYPVKDDWTLMVKQDLKDLKINLSIEKIKKIVLDFQEISENKNKEFALTASPSNETKAYKNEQFKI